MSRPTDGPPDEPITLVIVEPRALLGIGVQEVLDREDDIEVVAHVRSPDEALAIVEEQAPDVLLVDAATDDPATNDANRRLAQGSAGSAVIVLGRDDDEATMAEALGIGAAAHVAEVAEPAELVGTIRRVAEGEEPLRDQLAAQPDLVERIIGDIVRSATPGIDVLTGRELEILGYVARGLRNRDIARQLGGSEQTVKNHVSAILHKLGVPNRTRAVTYAVRQGWLVLDEPAPAGRKMRS
ncbi:MAG TPA: response regulator transcription factor [Candidatus Limnocylindrales bacterium]|nr:response regulator transcription factor [Candidatus Limnocylindrales bacterium]